MSPCACAHAPAACCWLCGNARNWWAAARLRAYGSEALRCGCQRYRAIPEARAVKPAVVKHARCIRCNKPVTVGPRCGSCAQSERQRVIRRREVIRRAMIGATP